MAYGTKDEMLTVKNGIKVNYYCHVTLDELPNDIRELKENGLTIDKITEDETYSGYWRIDYYEIIPK